MPYESVASETSEASTSSTGSRGIGYDAVTNYPLPPNNTHLDGPMTQLVSKYEQMKGVQMPKLDVEKSSSFPGKVGAIATVQRTAMKFAPGHYNPTTPKGQQLIGHELDHVGDQLANKIPVTGIVNGHPINENPAKEAKADATGKKLAAKKPPLQAKKLGSNRGGSQGLDDYPIQRAKLTKVNNLTPQGTEDVILRFFNQLEADVIEGRNKIITNQFHHIPQVDGYMTRFVDNVVHYQTNEVFPTTISLMKAAAGYWIESYATKVKSPQSTLPSGYKFETQVSDGGTRPDVVITREGTEVAWIDITATGSHDHVALKSGSIWNNGRPGATYGFFTGEVQYDSFSDITFLGQDTPPEATSDYDYANAEDMYRLRNTYDTQIQADWRTVVYNIYYQGSQMAPERRGKLIRLLWYYAYGDSIDRWQVADLCSYTGTAKGQFAVTDLKSGSASGKLLAAEKNPERLQQALTVLTRFWTRTVAEINEWDDGPDDSRDDWEDKIGDDKTNFNPESSYSDWSSGVSSTNRVLTLAQTVPERSFSVDNYVLALTSNGFTVDLYRDDTTTTVARRIDLQNVQIQTVGPVNRDNSRARIQILAGDLAQYRYQEFFVATDRLADYSKVINAAVTGAASYAAETILQTDYPIKTYLAADVTKLAMHHNFSTEQFQTLEPVREGDSFTLIQSVRSGKRYVKTAQLIRFLKGWNIPFGGVKVQVSNPLVLPISGTWSVDTYSHSKEDKKLSPQLNLGGVATYALEPINESNPFTIVNTVTNGYRWLKTVDILDRLSSFSRAYFGHKVIRKNMIPVPGNTTGDGFKIFPNAANPTANTEDINLQTHALQVHGTIDDTRSLVIHVQKTDHSWYYAYMKDVLAYLDRLPSNTFKPFHHKGKEYGITKSGNTSTPMDIYGPFGGSTQQIDLKNVKVSALDRIHVESTWTYIRTDTGGHHLVKTKDLVHYLVRWQTNLNSLNIIAPNKKQIPKTQSADYKLNAYHSYLKPDSNKAGEINFKTHNVYLPFPVEVTLNYTPIIFQNNKFYWLKTSELLTYLKAYSIPYAGVDVKLNNLKDIPKNDTSKTLSLYRNKNLNLATNVDISVDDLKLVGSCLDWKIKIVMVQYQGRLYWMNSRELFTYLDTRSGGSGGITLYNKPILIE
ncbi:MAG TPA: hypothetical protein DCE41_36675 [Cytophagales bacterium]|nr:hypothetical protein [Cytophagales bacterium]